MALHRKIYLAFVVFILVPISLLGIVSYRLSYAAIKEKVGQETLQTLRATDLNIRNVVEQADSFSGYVIASEEIQSFLKHNNKDSLLDFYYQRQAIAGILYGQNALDDLILYSAGGSDYHFMNGDILPFRDFQQTDFYRRMLEAEGKSVWLPPTERYPDQKKWSFMLGRTIKDTLTLKNLGYLILEINIKRFDDIFLTRYPDGSRELLMDSNGNILYEANHDNIGKRLELPIVNSLSSETEGTLIDTESGQKSLISYITSDSLHPGDAPYYLISIKPWSAVSKETDYIRNTTVWLVGFVILLAVLFNFLYVRQIVSFIIQLLARMKKIESGNLNASMPEYRSVELSRLAYGFNRMSNRLRQLVEEVRLEQEHKRKAQFQVLQNQINPHFLYNTLESVNALALMNHQKPISNIVINLGRLLRSSIHADDEVTVNHELNHVVSYIEIQKVRFDDRFSYKIEVDHALLDHHVLKLVLQPLVENSLLRGYSKKKPDFSIHITGGINARGDGYLRVQDNGTGIDDDTLQRILQQMSAAKPGLVHGLSNVQGRLRMWYGDCYGLMICSHPHEGTAIQLNFPLKREAAK
ncbi:sensor histidine kinase [Paenibacillus tritici]|uniref:Sensor histidine kinase n=1 Tax=Paenibacillus tritici TaxID=1873425 RepID=A0ABX2DJ57_9BACL|nr:sensor histidine kinase [Paenibacillus tritici]NQX44653.1 sensor histidine kinase [Paenibacillus tritici]